MPEPEQVRCRELKAMGCRTVLLTGDRKKIGEAIAEELGAGEVRTQLLPEEKMEWVRNLRLEGNYVVRAGKAAACRTRP